MYTERLKCGWIWEDREEDKRKGTTYQDSQWHLILKLLIIYYGTNWSLSMTFPFKIICLSEVDYGYQLITTMTFPTEIWISFITEWSLKIHTPQKSLKPFNILRNEFSRDFFIFLTYLHFCLLRKQYIWFKVFMSES